MNGNTWQAQPIVNGGSVHIYCNSDRRCRLNFANRLKTIVGIRRNFGLQHLPGNTAR
jgi:hypothetical protein